MPRRRWMLLSVGLLAACLAAGCLGTLWAASLFSVNDATLVSVGDPDLAAFDCLVSGRFVQPGPAVKLNTEWIIHDDLVPVLANFRRQGWLSTTHTPPIQLVPVAAPGFNAGLVQVKVLRALSLSYTEAGATRIVATTRVVACPP